MRERDTCEKNQYYSTIKRRCFKTDPQGWIEVMERNDRLICKTFRGVLIVQTVSLISAICAILIDAIVIGRFLGSDSVAAMGLIQPVVWLMNLIGTLFGPGLSIVCTRYTGMVKPERVREVFSLVMITIATIAITVACIVFVLSPSLADLLGAKTNDPELIRMISKYLRGYCFGMPFMMLSMVLTGLMMLDNHRKLGVAAVLTTLISDTVLDLLNVIVFHGGMRGMAIATSLSNIAGFLVLLTHFLRKERILRFQLSGLNLLDLKEIVLNSVPNGLSTASVSIRNLFFNTMILAIATKVEVSALLLYYDHKKKKLPHAFMTLAPSMDESQDAIGRILDWLGKNARYTMTPS